LRRDGLYLLCLQGNVKHHSMKGRGERFPERALMETRNRPTLPTCRAGGSDLRQRDACFVTRRAVSRRPPVLGELRQPVAEIVGSGPATAGLTHIRCHLLRNRLAEVSKNLLKARTDAVPAAWEVRLEGGRNLIESVSLFRRRHPELREKEAKDVGLLFDPFAQRRPDAVPGARRCA